MALAQDTTAGTSLQSALLDDPEFLRGLVEAGRSYQKDLIGGRLESFKKVHSIQEFEGMKAMRGEHGRTNGDPRAI